MGEGPAAKWVRDIMRLDAKANVMAVKNFGAPAAIATVPNAVYIATM